jgi:predicted nicotinamide N-methyase
MPALTGPGGAAPDTHATHGAAASGPPGCLPPEAAADPVTDAGWQFIRAHTRLTRVALVPEIRLHLAEEPMGLWELTEQALGRSGLQPPFWAFAWPGGQALARYVLDNPGVVRGRRVIDLATGSGLAAIAAALAGAAAVTATDIDPFAAAAAALNASANAAAVTVTAADVLSGDGAAGRAGDGGARRAVSGAAGAADVVLAGDAFYAKELAGRVLGFLRRAHAGGADVLVGDLGRRYLPRSGFAELAAYDVPVLRALEDTAVKRTAVLRPAW